MERNVKITIRWNVARWDTREVKSHQKDDRFWLVWEIFNEYIKQKADFHSVGISRLMKDQSCKKRSRRKTDSNINFF